MPCKRVRGQRVRGVAKGGGGGGGGTEPMSPTKSQTERAMRWKSALSPLESARALKVIQAPLSIVCVENHE
jgi:hypothetical protein